MPWVRIDDGFARHPKLAQAGPLGMAMQVAALCYCNQELTDGFVPRSVARTLLDFTVEDGDGRLWTITRGCGMIGDDITPEWIIGILLEAGLWEEAPGGYRIHDFHDYQPSKEHVLHEREGNRKRQAAFRERNAVTNDVTNAASNGPVTDAPYPYPVPVENVSKPSVSHPPARGGYTRAFEEFWTKYPRVVNSSKKKAAVSWGRLKPEVQALALAGLDKYLASDGWRRGFAPHATTYLNGALWESDPPPARMNGHEARDDPIPPDELAELKRRALA